MNDEQERAANREAVRQFFDPSRRPERKDLFDANMNMVLPFGGRVLSRDLWLGLAELDEEKEIVQEMFSGTLIHHDPIVFEGVDPHDFWVFTHFDDDTLLYGRPYPQRFIHHFTLHGGKVTRWDEYFDSFLLSETIKGNPVQGSVPEITGLRRDSPRRFDDPDRARAENEAALRAFLSGDPYAPNGRAALWAPHAIKELAWVPPGFPKRRWTGIDELLAETHEGRDLFEYSFHTDVKVFPTDDPEIFWATSIMDPRCRLNGHLYPQRFVLGFRVEDGKVVVFQEFFDTALVASVSDFDEVSA